jgi:hypothetical protein
MESFKRISADPASPVQCWHGALALVVCVALAGSATAETCLAPPRPFVPSDARAVRDYADILRSDFDLYIRDIQSYFRCLDAERARAFEEAREVSEEYGRFLQLLEN